MFQYSRERLYEQNYEYSTMKRMDERNPIAYSKNHNIGSEYLIQKKVGTKRDGGL